MDNLQILIKTYLDIQKEQSELNKKVQNIKLEAIKVGVVIDDAAAKKLIDQENKIQNAIAKTIQTRNKINRNDEKSQAVAINKALEREYDLKQKLVKVESDRAQKQVSDFNKGNLNAIDYEIQKREELSRVFSNQIKAQMEARSAEEKVQSNFNKSNLNGIDYEIQKREQASKAFSAQLKAQMEASVTEAKLQKSTLQVTMDKSIASNKLQGYLKNNTIAAKTFGSEFEALGVKLSKVTNADELKSWNKEFAGLTSQVKATGREGLNFFEKLGKNASKFFGWIVTSGAVMLSITALKNMVTSVVDLDRSFTEIQKVTTLAGDSLDKFTEKAFKLGATIGRTGKEVVDAVSIFAKAGYDINSSLGLSKAALVMTNVGDGISNVEEASSALISVLKGFREFNDSDAMRIVDMINETSNTAPIDFDNITEGLRRISGTMAQTGTSIEETIGLITGGFGQLRDVEMVSSGLSMVSQRLRGMSEDGEEIDGLMPKLAKDFKEIANIDIEDANGELRSTFDILSDMARVFPSLTSEQRQYLGELAAGNVALHVAKAA